MADDTPKPEEVVFVANVPPPDPEPEPEPEKPVLISEESHAAVAEEEEKVKEKEKEKPAEEEKVTESASFVEETNVVGELPDSQKKALEELKQLVQEALNKHEFTVPPKVVEKPAEEAPKEEAKETPKEEAKEMSPEEEPPKVEAEVPPPPPALEEEAPAVAVVEEVVEKVAEVDDDGTKTVEAIKETIVEVAVPPPAEAEASTEPPKEVTEKVAEPPKETEAVPEVPPPPPEEVFIWGIPLLGDERSDVILLKFLRARDFKVKEAFTMIKNTVIWRKEFGIEYLLEEDLGTELDKVVFGHGVDKEGHPVCYNVFGEFQNKELYQNTLADEEKRKKFLKWRIQFLEKSIRKLDFSPTGICTIVQVNDLKNSPFFTKKELRQATSQAVQLLQDNYPEFVAKQLFINMPWWYFVFYSLISPFMTQRTKSKFVISRSTEALFKYIAPEHVPVQYGGLSREGEQEFSIADPTTEVTVKPSSTHTIEFPVTESCVLVWEVRAVGWEVSYGAEFVPSAEGSYTVIIQKSRKVAAVDETVVTNTFKIGEPGKVVLTVDNPSYKKKKLLYRSKTKPYTD